MNAAADGALPSAGGPALRALATQLRQVTERIAADLGAPLAEAPDWNHRHWELARAAAVMHGVSPLLDAQLTWRGPADWHDFLRGQREQVALRQQRIERLLAALDERARAAGVAVLMLKGASLHRLGYCQAGLRPMGDVDLLVRPEDLSRLDPLLHALGYLETASSWRHRVFDPVRGNFDPVFGEHADAPIRIEVHTRVAERLPWTTADITAQLRAGIDSPGLHPYASAVVLLQHQLHHAAGNMASRWLRLLQLHDLRSIAATMDDGQWQQWLQLAMRHGSLWWAYPPLRLTERYFPGVVPAGVLQAARRESPALLRARADRQVLTAVSGSSLWVSGAPAWAWSRTPVELVTYLARRLVPPAAEMAYCSRTSQSLSWHRSGNWYSLPQGLRILKWLTRRPPRPQILHALHQAQRQAPGSAHPG